MRALFVVAALTLGTAAPAQTFSCSEPVSSPAGTAIAGLSAVSLACSVTANLASGGGSPNLACRSDGECHPSYICLNKSCVRRSAPIAQRTEGAALFLRTRVVELREELVLGRGPVVHVLAVSGQWPEAALSATLRQNRKELVALIGDGTDPQWSTRFLQRLDALIAG